jgi:hypothetical protein
MLINNVNGCTGIFPIEAVFIADHAKVQDKTKNIQELTGHNIA